MASISITNAAIQQTKPMKELKQRGDPQLPKQQHQSTCLDNGPMLNVLSICSCVGMLDVVTCLICHSGWTGMRRKAPLTSDFHTTRLFFGFSLLYWRSAAIKLWSVSSRAPHVSERSIIKFWANFPALKWLTSLRFSECGFGM